MPPTATLPARTSVQAFVRPIRPVDDDLTRRAAISGFVAAALLGLGACSTEPSATPSPSATAASRTVTTSHGPLVVPTDPRRIVSVHSWTTESLFDLGITPIGVEDAGAEYVPARYLSTWKGIDKVITGSTLNAEKIAALHPDLIVGVSVPYLDKVYQQLSAIAPTAFIPFDGDWKNYATSTAAFVNQAKKLDALKAGYDAKITQAKADYADVLATKKWDVIQGGFDQGNYWIYGPDSTMGQILTELGARFASASAAVKGDNTNSVSYEKAGLLSDADFILYYQNNDGSPANNISQLFAAAPFKKLAAARPGHLIGTPDFLAGSYGDATGALDTIVKALAGTA